MSITSYAGKTLFFELSRLGRISIGQRKIEVVNLLNKTPKAKIKHPESRDNKGYLSA